MRKTANVARGLLTSEEARRIREDIEQTKKHGKTTWTRSGAAVSVEEQVGNLQRELKAHGTTLPR